MPDKQQRNTEGLKPRWKKGESGNPNGRPKKGFAIADILNQIGDTVKDDKTRREVVLEKAYIMAETGDLNAIKFIADRTEGKALERIETNISEAPFESWRKQCENDNGD